MSFRMLQADVLRWAKDKDLLHIKNASKQFMKFIEEVFEFNVEMVDFIHHLELSKRTKIYDKFSGATTERNMKLEMGDIFVTLIILCEQIGIDPEECLEMAYEKIKNRKGKTLHGNFYKQEDLEGMEWEK